MIIVTQNCHLCYMIACQHSKPCLVYSCGSFMFELINHRFCNGIPTSPDKMVYDANVEVFILP